MKKKELLQKLADDVNLYFGLGCRNVTKIYVPRDYNFEPLLEAMRKYEYLAALVKSTGSAPADILSK